MAQPVEPMAAGSMDCRAGKARAPNRLPRARNKGLGDGWAASAGAAGAAPDSAGGWKPPPAALSSFAGVPIGSGGVGASAAALGMAASVLATTTRAVNLPSRRTGKSSGGGFAPAAPFQRSGAGFVGGSGAPAGDRRSAAEGTNGASGVPSGRADTLRSGSGSVVCGALESKSMCGLSVDCRRNRCRVRESSQRPCTEVCRRAGDLAARILDAGDIVEGRRFLRCGRASLKRGNGTDQGDPGECDRHTRQFPPTKTVSRRLLGQPLPPPSPEVLDIKGMLVLGIDDRGLVGNLQRQTDIG